MRGRMRASGSRAVQVAPHDSAAEVEARGVARRSEPASAAGHFEFSHVTAQASASARVHVDGTAERLAGLVGANAVTYGRDVFIPPARYAPGTPRGRALIAHELAHVARAGTEPPMLFREGPPLAHYPTAGEQKEIEGILGRHTSAPQPVATPAGKPAPATPATTIVDTGTHLSATQITDQAAAFMDPFVKALNTRFDTSSPPTKKYVNTIDEAMAISEKARAAIHSTFGSYLVDSRKFTLTKDDTLSTAELRARTQVQVSLGSDNSDVDVFIPNILETVSQETSDALAPLDDESKDAVEREFIALVHADTSLLRRVKIAHLNALGGKYDPATRIYTLTPYGSDPYANAVHELLHASTHPAFTAAFGHNKIAYEGFTEYFTRQVAGVGDRTGSYDDVVAKIVRLRDAMFDGFGADSPEESLRRAYFKGELDLIGWRPNTKVEEAFVKSALPGQKPWDADTAKAMDAPRVKHGRAELQPHDNLLGVGYYMHARGDGTFSMRYARVLHDVDPYSKTRLFAVGHLEGSPTRFGGDLGLGIEYQRPWMYINAAVAGSGSAARSGPPDLRLGADVSAELGVRLWHRVRLGADAFVLFQLSPSKSLDAGAGLKVGVEF